MTETPSPPDSGGTYAAERVAEAAQDIRHEMVERFRGLGVDYVGSNLSLDMDDILRRHIAPLVATAKPERFGIEAAMRAAREGKRVRQVGRWKDNGTYVFYNEQLDFIYCTLSGEAGCCLYTPDIDDFTAEWEVLP